MSLLTLALIHLVAVASPGPGFAILFRHTINFSFKNGVVTAIGIAFGDLVLILISVFGSAFIIEKNPAILQVIQALGALYLTGLGFKTLKMFFRSIIRPPEVASEHAHVVSGSFQKSFVEGFVTTIGNPKAIIYFVSISSQWMKPGQTHFDLFVLILTLMVITFVWFSTVAGIIGSKRIRPHFMKYRFYIDGLMGLVLVLYGVYFLMTWSS